MSQQTTRRAFAVVGAVLLALSAGVIGGLVVHSTSASTDTSASVCDAVDVGATGLRPWSRSLPVARQDLVRAPVR